MFSFKTFFLGSERVAEARNQDTGASQQRERERERLGGFSRRRRVDRIWNHLLSWLHPCPCFCFLFSFSQGFVLTWPFTFAFDQK